MCSVAKHVEQGHAVPEEFFDPLLNWCRPWLPLPRQLENRDSDNIANQDHSADLRREQRPAPYVNNRKNR